MLGDDSSNVFVLDELRRALDKGGGGNGAGNGGGDGGDDRYERLRGVPIDARDLVLACKQVCDFAAKLVEMTTDRETALIERLMLMVEKSETRTLGQVLELLKTEHEARASLTPILVRRFEAIEHNLQMVERHLGVVYVERDGGAGSAKEAAS
jgi:hypothetical protein